MDRVGSLLERAVLAGMAPGFVALAVRDGEGGRAWCAGVTAMNGGAVSPEVQYDLASLTKPLATATLLLLARREGFDLEVPLAEVLPELEGSAWEASPIWQCASHCAGFPAWVPLYAMAERTREGYLTALASVQPAYPAGQCVVYSCPGFIALGLALERGFGCSLDELFAADVAEPLGLGGEISYAPAGDSPVAAGQRTPAVEAAALRELGIAGAPPPALTGVASCDDGNARGLGGAAGNAGLFGTAAAVAALAAEYLPGGGELVTSEEAALATRCWTEGLEQARGIGWQLASTPGCSAGPALPPMAFGHTGFTGTSVWVDPVDRVVLVLLGNRLHPGGRTADLHPLRRRFHQVASRALSGGS